MCVSERWCFQTFTFDKRMLYYQLRRNTSWYKVQMTAGLWALASLRRHAEYECQFGRLTWEVHLSLRRGRARDTPDILTECRGSGNLVASARSWTKQRRLSRIWHASLRCVVAK